MANGDSRIIIVVQEYFLIFQSCPQCFKIGLKIIIEAMKKISKVSAKKVAKPVAKASSAAPVIAFAKAPSRIPAITIIVVSLIGMVNAIYLTYLFLQDKWGEAEKSFCDINASLSCSSVVTSQYAQFMGVPVCTIALFVYPILIVLAWMTLGRRKTKNLFYAISLLSAMGLMLNIVYIYNEVTYIKALCALCILCTVFIATNLVMSIRGYSKAQA